MITANKGELKREQLILQFNIRINEDEIFPDALRITQECAYHLKAELKQVMTNEEQGNFCTALMHLFITQILVIPKSEVSLKVVLEKMKPVRWDTYKFDDRVVESITNENVLTEGEKVAIDTFFQKHFPGHKTFN